MPLGEVDAFASPTTTTTATTTTPKSRHRPSPWEGKEVVKNVPAPEPTSLEKEIALLEQRAAREWPAEQRKGKIGAGTQGLDAFDRRTANKLIMAYSE